MNRAEALPPSVSHIFIALVNCCRPDILVYFVYAMSGPVNLCFIILRAEKNCGKFSVTAYYPEIVYLIPK